MDFADPDPDSDFANAPRTNPPVLLAVPEPATLSCLAGGIGVVAAVRPSERVRAREA